MNATQPGTLFGHPTGLYTLFFAEMWERFSFYGMRALLLFYMIKGFLGYGDRDAYAIYGAYTALVYMTPLFGGMLADRLLGARRAVVLGGLLMAAGHLMMSAENDVAFFLALALLIVGNGFFKPNISTMVGSLYPQGTPKRDTGFTIFYMGINLGAAMSPLLCGYIGETYGWHYGFGLATLGMLTGLAVFVAPVRITQFLIMSGAAAGAVGLFYFRPDNAFSTGVNIFVGLALLIAGVIAWVALGRGGLPDEVGAPADLQRLRKPVAGPISAEWSVYLMSLLAVPLLALLVSANRNVTVIPSAVVDSLNSSGNAVLQVSADVLAQMSTPAGLILMLAGLVALAYLGTETLRLEKVPRERMFVVLILTFFSMLFWAFFEQAGSSVNNFTDRNVDRVAEQRRLTASDLGSTLTFRVPVQSGDPDLMRLPLLTQEQLGHRNASPAMKQQIEEAIRIEERRKGKLTEEEMDRLVASASQHDRLTMSGLTYLRAAASAAGGSAQVSMGGDPGKPGHGDRWLRESGLGFSGCQPGLHSSVRDRIQRVVDLSGANRPGAQHASEVFPGAVAVGAWLRSLLVRRPKRRRTGYGGALLGLSGVPAANHRGALPLTRRALHGDPAVPGAPGEHGDGNLVPGNRLLSISGGHHRPVHRRHRRGQW